MGSRALFDPVPPARGARGVLATARALVRASHPGPVAAVTAASGGYALAVGRSSGGVAAVLAAVLAGQLSVGWSNDAIDAARDRAARRVDKPVATGALALRAVTLGALIALGATVGLSLLSGWRAAGAHLLAVALGWAYNARLKASAASIVPFALAFALLACFVTLGAPGSPLPPWWAPTGAGLLGSGAHLLNALPDLDADRALGVLGLPHRLGRTATLALAGVLCWASSAVLAGASGLAPLLAALGLAGASGLGAGALLAARRRGSRRPFHLVLLLALLDVALVLAATRAHR